MKTALEILTEKIGHVNIGLIDAGDNKPKPTFKEFENLLIEAVEAYHAQFQNKPSEDVREEKHMPVMRSSNDGLMNVPDKIPFSVLSNTMAQKNHSQTLERLAQRGGMSIGEIACNAFGKSIRSIFDGELTDNQETVDKVNIWLKNTLANRGYIHGDIPEMTFEQFSLEAIKFGLTSCSENGYIDKHTSKALQEFYDKYLRSKVKQEREDKDRYIQARNIRIGDIIELFDHANTMKPKPEKISYVGSITKERIMVNEQTKEVVLIDCIHINFANGHRIACLDANAYFKKIN